MTTKTKPGRVPGRAPHAASARLRQLLTLDAPDLLALLLGVERETVHGYARGIRRPDPRVRVRLEPLGITADDWRNPPALDPAAMPPVGAA